MITPGMLVKLRHGNAVYTEKGDVYYAVTGEPIHDDPDVRKKVTMVVVYVDDDTKTAVDIPAAYDVKVMVICDGRLGWIFSSWVKQCE